jgi:hypothetical protein
MEIGLPPIRRRSPESPVCADWNSVDPEVICAAVPYETGAYANCGDWLSALVSAATVFATSV